MSSSNSLYKYISLYDESSSFSNKKAIELVTEKDLNKKLPDSKLTVFCKICSIPKANVALFKKCFDVDYNLFHTISKCNFLNYLCKYQKDIEVFKVFLENGALKYIDIWVKSLFKYCNNDIIKLCIDTEGLKINYIKDENDEDNSYLHILCQRNDLSHEVYELALKKINKPDELENYLLYDKNRNGRTPINILFNKNLSKLLLYILRNKSN